MSPPIVMKFKDPDQDGEVQAAIEQEKTAIEDVKNAYKAKKTGEKERKKLWKQKEEKASQNRNLKAAISRRKAATQTLLALQGKDPVPKVGNLYLKWAEWIAAFSIFNLFSLHIAAQ